MPMPHEPAFDAEAFLNAAGIARAITQYGRGDCIFQQGERCDHVLYIQKGAVKLSVASPSGRENIVAILSPGDFFGEGCLAGQPVRLGRATAMTDSAILHIGKARMGRFLHEQHALSEGFIAHMSARNSRIQWDLVDQLFHATEKQLARTLHLLAH
jgi:CRP/FNR family cyclic AMP-dependent transcriptional regulator